MDVGFPKKYIAYVFLLKLHRVIKENILKGYIIFRINKHNLKDKIPLSTVKLQSVY